jgi:bifunctional DNase/RNase
LPLHQLIRGIVLGGNVNDSVATDAKRILLRYGAPIAVLEHVSEDHRVEFAREISRTTLADREPRTKELLLEHGYLEED